MASKRIVVTTDVYEMLRRQKLPGESFSNLLQRLVAGKRTLSAHYGALADEPEEFFERMKRGIAAMDRASERASRESHTGE